VSLGEVVLLTGASGFLGSYMARELSAAGHRVIGLDAVQPPPERAGELAVFYRIRLPDPGLEGVVSRHRPWACLHCAGGSSVPASLSEPWRDFQAGAVVTYQLLEVLRRLAPECRTVFMSSAAVYGDPPGLPVSESAPAAPLSPYGLHKLMAEQAGALFRRLYGLPFAALRVFSAFGEGLRRQVVWDLCRKVLREGRLYLMGTGRETRDFIHAADVARAARLVAERAPLQGEVYNLALGRELSIAELARLVAGELGYRGAVEFDGLLPAGTPRRWRADTARLQALGFRPRVELEEGLRAFVRWCREQLQAQEGQD